MFSTVATLKGHLGIPDADTSKDSMLALYLRGASEFIESKTARKFELLERTELHSGDGQIQLFLKQYPITEINQVVIDGSEIDIDAELLSGDLVVDDGGVLVRRDGFPEGVKNVKVVYSAGYIMPSSEESGEVPNLPADLELAALKLAGRVYEKRKAEGVSQVSPGSFSVSYQQELDPEITETIDQYRKLQC